MSIDTKHPLYTEFEPDWVQQRDLYRGERAVKAKGPLYLPPTEGMHLDGLNPDQPGGRAYKSYVQRAVFHDFVKDGVEALVGLMHQKEPTIELPEVMEPLRERATNSGETLAALLRRINTEQLITGRIGLLADLPSNPDQANPLPYIVTYIAESITNWDVGEETQGYNALNLVVLNESGFVREGFEWEYRTSYRVLQLGDFNANEAENSGATYRMGVFEDQGDGVVFDESKMMEPVLRGKKLDQIPFVFANTKDIVATPDDPPLLGLGRLSLAIYRGEADYRQSLFMQGQDTLVVIGGVRSDGLPGEDDDALRTGAGSRIDLDVEGDAKYIGVSSSGLSEQRSAIENDCKKAESRAGQLISARGNQQESGEALKTRLTAQTATLNQIALAGSSALENLLRTIATWMGANPDEVSVDPNLEFADFDLSGQDLVYLMQARAMGAPISKESIHALMVDRGITKFDYETEMELVNNDAAGSPFEGGVDDNDDDVDPNLDNLDDGDQ